MIESMKTQLLNPYGYLHYRLEEKFDGLSYAGLTLGLFSVHVCSLIMVGLTIVAMNESGANWISCLMDEYGQNSDYQHLSKLILGTIVLILYRFWAFPDKKLAARIRLFKDESKQDRNRGLLLLFLFYIVSFLLFIYSLGFFMSSVLK